MAFWATSFFNHTLADSFSIIKHCQLLCQLCCWLWSVISAAIFFSHNCEIVIESSNRWMLYWPSYWKPCLFEAVINLHWQWNKMSITFAGGGFRFTASLFPWSSLPESESTSLADSTFWGTGASSSSSSSSLPPPALLASLSEELAGCKGNSCGD